MRSPIAAVLTTVFSLTLFACNTSSKSSGTLYTVEDRVSYDSTDPTRLATIYRPLGASASSSWIFGVHGGAFMGGSRYDLGVYAAEFCPLGYTVVAVDYHLTTQPGGVWPAPLRDCQAALRFFRANAQRFGLDPAHFVVMGGSAGGCLATHLGLEDDPVSPLGRARYVVDISGEQDLRLLDQCMSDDDRITSLLLGHAGPWSEAELLGPSNVGRARSDVEFFVVHGTLNQDTYVVNSDLIVAELRAAGASVEYARVEGGGMWAMNEPTTNAALHAWLAARLR